MSFEPGGTARPNGFVANDSHIQCHARQGLSRRSVRRRERAVARFAVGNVVNLNRFRKKKTRESEAKQAEINRVRHGRTKAQKEGERADKARAARLLAGKRLENASKEPEE